MVEKPCCRNCAFSFAWEHDRPEFAGIPTAYLDPEFGTCRRYPPQTDIFSMPQVPPGFWCGEHKFKHGEPRSPVVVKFPKDDAE